MITNGIGFKEKSSYQEKSQIFKKKQTIKVFLENYTDNTVWRDAFPKRDDLIIRFTTLTMPEDRKLLPNPGNGCRKLEEFAKSYVLGNNLIICLDSDFDYILSVMNSTADQYDENFIFETYAHSIENIKFYENFIVEGISRKVWEDEKTESLKCIYSYYKEFSNSIYDPLVRTLFLKNVTNETITNNEEIFKVLDKFNKIKISKTSDFENFSTNQLWTSIKKSLIDLSKKLDSEIKLRSLESEYKLVQQRLNESNINESNIYVFFRGHNIESLLKSHLISFYDIFFNDKVKNICNVLPTQQEQSDCKKNLFNEKETFSLNYSRNLKEHPFMKKSVERIQEIL